MNSAGVSLVKDSISRNVFVLLPPYCGLVLWKGLSHGGTVIIMTKLQGSNPGRVRDFSFFFYKNILTNSGAHPASYSMGTLESNCSPPSSFSFKKKWSYIPTSREYVFVARTEKTLRLVLEGLRMITEVDKRLPNFKEGYSECGRVTNPPCEVVKLM
jgi:hypothetical protein